jgi:BioD-like phosphotransacetylase family protein
LILTPGDREDIIMMALDYDARASARDHLAGVVLTNGMIPHSSVLELIRARELPVISTRADVSAAATAIARMTVKTEVGDKDKIALIQRLISENVDVDALVKRVMPVPRPELQTAALSDDPGTRDEETNTQDQD